MLPSPDIALSIRLVSSTIYKRAPAPATAAAPSGTSTLYTSLMPVAAAALPDLVQEAAFSLLASAVMATGAYLKLLMTVVAELVVALLPLTEVVMR